jgi:hypothetical protein
MTTPCAKASHFLNLGKLARLADFFLVHDQSGKLRN